MIGLNDDGTLHYMFHPEAWGNGYCQEALKALLSSMFQRENWRQSLDAYVLCNNSRSRRVLEKCGFEEQDIANSVNGPEQRLSTSEEQELRESIMSLGLQNSRTESERGTESSGSQRKMLRYTYSRPHSLSAVQSYAWPDASIDAY